MKKISHTITLVGMALTFVLILLMFYWAVLDGVYVNPVTNNTHIIYQTNKTSYKAGEDVFVSAQGFCKLRNLVATTYINLVDTVAYPYEAKHRSIPAGCTSGSQFTQFVTLPKNLEGTYHLSGRHAYEDVNPIRGKNNSIDVFFTSNEFTITK